MKDAGNIDFTKRRMSGEDIRGPIVYLYLTYFSGITECIGMPALCAMLALLGDEHRGVAYRSARIDWGDVYAPDWDVSA